MTKKSLFLRWALGTVMVSCLLIMSGCSPGSEMTETEDDELRFTIDVESPLNPYTRGAVMKPATFTMYALYGVNGVAAFARNIIYTKVGDEFVYNTKPKKPKVAVNYYCVNMSFEDPAISNVEMGETKHFDYTLPEIVEDQKYLMYSSILNTTSNDNHFTFSAALSNVYVSVYSTLSTVDVKVGGYTLYNAVKTGTFTFSDTKAKTGDWTLPDTPEYVNYTRTFLDGDQNDAPVLITAASQAAASPIPSSDSAVFMLPQVLTAWNPAESSTAKPSQGIAAHQCLVELKCKITDKEAPTHYRLGSATEYGRLYFPYNGNPTLKKQRTYTCIIDIAQCYDENGELFKDTAGDDNNPLTTIEVDTNRDFNIDIMNNWESTADDIEVFAM